MTIKVFYRPNSEHATSVETYVRDLQHQHDIKQIKLELVSVDSREGADGAALYDIWSFPAILVTSNTGSVVNLWQGEPLPLMDEIIGYLK